jgi:diaminopimelate epimerase
VQITKHHGLGNDFLVVLDEVNGRRLGASVDGALAERLCDRRRGVGADGLIHGEQSLDGDADVRMHLFNADGGRAEMSGNGIRCLAQALAVARDEHETDYRIDTDAGRRLATVHASADFHDCVVQVSMGVVAAGPSVPGPLDERLGGRFATVSVGNPHLVMEVADPAAVDLASEGGWLEQQFADGINVEFVAPSADPDALELTVWERGVGVTEACGTGACAAAFVARDWGLVGDRVRVDMPGGSAEVALDGAEVTLIGPSHLVATIELPDP